MSDDDLTKAIEFHQSGDFNRAILLYRGILDGDYLIVQRGGRPRAGELAVARWGKKTGLVEVAAGRLRIVAVDGNRSSVSEDEIFGRVIAVMRSLREVAL